MTQREKIKAILREQNKCSSCKYGVIGKDTVHCTRNELVSDTLKEEIMCDKWEPLEIDDKTRIEFQEFREEISRYGQ
jgi:hypothetical protein